MWQYLKSREFWLTVGGLIVAGIAGFIGIFYWFLPAYTKHGDSVIVPEVAKMELEEAVSALEDRGLRFEVADSVYMAGMSPLSIVSQDPAGLSKVKPGRRVYLTVNKSVPPMVKFPDVLNVSVYQAKLRLDGWKLAINRIEYVPHEFRNVVLEAKFDGKVVKAGDLLPEGTRVTLYAGQGLSRERIGVPDLVGLPYESAISTLHELGLNIGGVRYKPDEEGEKGLIIRQNPVYYPGDSVQMGSSIDLFVSGPEPEETLESGIQEEEISDQ